MKKKILLWDPGIAILVFGNDPAIDVAPTLMFKESSEDLVTLPEFKQGDWLWTLLLFICLFWVDWTCFEYFAIPL